MNSIRFEESSSFGCSSELFEFHKHASPSGSCVKLSDQATRVPRVTWRRGLETFLSKLSLSPSTFSFYFHAWPFQEFPMSKIVNKVFPQRFCLSTHSLLQVSGWSAKMCLPDLERLWSASELDHSASLVRTDPKRIASHREQSSAPSAAPSSVKANPQHQSPRWTARISTTNRSTRSSKLN